MCVETYIQKKIPGPIQHGVTITYNINKIHRNHKVFFDRLYTLVIIHEWTEIKLLFLRKASWRNVSIAFRFARFVEYACIQNLHIKSIPQCLDHRLYFPCKSPMLITIAMPLCGGSASQNIAVGGCRSLVRQPLFCSEGTVVDFLFWQKIILTFNGIISL